MLTRRTWLVAAASAALPLQRAVAQEAPSLLDPARVPWIGDTGRAAYRNFLDGNLPRAFAIAPDGRYGQSGPDAAADARQTALRACAGAGAKDGCVVYADGLDVVLPAQAWHAAPPPGPLVSTWNYAIIPDPRFLWHGPAAAAGIYVWAHGTGGGDSRGRQPQSHVRLFNNAGWDIVRFDRDPAADDSDRAAGWLRDALTEMRRRGWKRVAAGGQSRGAWNSLQMLDSPGLADIVVAMSPAAHGNGGSVFAGAQSDELRQIVAGVAAGPSRLVFVQFNGDPFIGDPDTRAALISRLRPRLGGLLLIDRPAGFSGHGAAADPAFAAAYGACIYRFATSANPASAC